jgi:Leucine-rich repeat (LRR) protein
MKKLMTLIIALFVAAGAWADPATTSATVTTDAEFTTALNDDDITEIYLKNAVETPNYQLFQAGTFTRTVAVTLFADDIAATSIRVAWGTNDLTNVNGDDESYKTALARGSVYRANQSKDAFDTALGSDDGEELMTWDILITAMYFYKDEAPAKIDELADGEYKTEFQGEIDALKTYYEGITALNMNDKNTSVFEISSGALESFTGLTELRISNTTIADLGGLIGLTNIKIFEAEGNEIEDLGALADMVALEELYVADNKLTELNVLFIPGVGKTEKHKTNLKKLNATNNDIENVIALAQLVQEEAFDADNAEWDIRDNAYDNHSDIIAHIGIIEGVFNAATDAVFLHDLKAKVTNDEEFFAALDNDKIISIIVTSEDDYQFYNIGGEGEFTRTTDVALFAEDIATTSIRVSWGTNVLTNVNGEEESYKTALARGSVYRANQSKENFKTALAEDAGEAAMTWDILITAMHFYKDEAPAKIADLAAGQYKDDFQSEIDALKDYYEGITALNMNDKTETVFTISSGALESFTGLTELRISNTGIADLGGLIGLTNIKIFEAEGNEIEDLGALADMLDLEELYVANNKLTNLNVLYMPSTKNGADKSKTKLSKLDASGNDLENVIALAQLVDHLDFNADNAHWDVTDNPLTDPDNLEHLAIILNKFNAAENAVFLADMIPPYNENTGTYFGNLQAAIDAAEAGETIRIPGGTYAGNLDTSGKGGVTLYPGDSPACITVTGTFTVTDQDELIIDIEGTTECTEYTQLTIEGAIDLAGIDLIIQLGSLPAEGDEFVIIKNESGSAVTNEFDQGTAEFSIEYNGSTVFFALTYNVGTDDDVVLTVTNVETPAIPLANWALYLGFILMALFVAIRFRGRVL